MLDQLPPIEHEDPVSVADRRQTVRNDKDGSTAADGGQVLLDDPLGLIIQGTRRLIEDQDPRIRHQRPRDGDSLSLSARESRAALPHRRVVGFGQLQDEFVCAGQLRRLNDLRHGSPGKLDRNVLPYRAVEEKTLLEDHSDLPAQPKWVGLLQIDPIDQNPAGFWDLEALQELRESALARAASTHHPDRRSGSNLAGQVPQDLRSVELVAEPDILEPHGTADGR